MNGAQSVIFTLGLLTHSGLDPGPLPQLSGPHWDTLQNNLVLYHTCAHLAAERQECVKPQQNSGFKCNIISVTDLVVLKTNSAVICLIPAGISDH